MYTPVCSVCENTTAIPLEFKIKSVLRYFLSIPKIFNSNTIVFGTKTDLGFVNSKFNALIYRILISQKYLNAAAFH